MSRAPAPLRPATAPLRPATAPLRPPTAPLRPATAPLRPATAPLRQTALPPADGHGPSSRPLGRICRLALAAGAVVVVACSTATPPQTPAEIEHGTEPSPATAPADAPGVSDQPPAEAGQVGPDAGDPAGPAGAAGAPAGRGAGNSSGQAAAGSELASTGGEEGSRREGDAKGDADTGACPVGMKLVEGEYCTEVKHQCLEKWYAPQNKKVVCEKFKKGYAKCVGKRVKKRFCIDTYAWPNEKGERPEVMNRFYQAQMKCAAVGKRLCTETEWTFACEGPDMKPFPYGWDRDPKKCWGDRPWDGPKMRKVAKRDPKELARLWQGVRSGSQPHCVSDFGVADLPGNNDEVVANVHHRGRKAKFESVHTGGPWYKGVRNQCRPKIYTHNEGFYYYFLGFRCCAAPDGQTTDPRTPWQRRKASRGRSAWMLKPPAGKRGWHKTMEGIAGWKWETLKRRLELKKTDPSCGCEKIRSRRRRIACKTMCGTLLGPGAKDGGGER